MSLNRLNEDNFPTLAIRLNENRITAILLNRMTHACANRFDTEYTAFKQSEPGLHCLPSPSKAVISSDSHINFLELEKSREIDNCIRRLSVWSISLLCHIN